jgi:hypothetical protein
LHPPRSWRYCASRRFSASLSSSVLTFLQGVSAPAMAQDGPPAVSPSTKKARCRPRHLALAARKVRGCHGVAKRTDRPCRRAANEPTWFRLAMLMAVPTPYYARRGLL